MAVCLIVSGKETQRISTLAIELDTFAMGLGVSDGT